MAERLVIRRNGGPSERRAPSTSSHAEPLNRLVRPTQLNCPKFLSVEFRSMACEEQFQFDFLHRSVTLSKYVDFTSWESLEIQEMFDRIGLQGVYNVRGDIYDRIIRLFYTNMSFSARSETIKTYILGTEIIITSEIVNRLIGFAGERAERYYQAVRNCPFMGTVEETEFLRQINQSINNVGSFKPTARDLNVKTRVIHNMVLYTLLPRYGHRDFVNFMDLYVMEKLYNGMMFDPGLLILSYMCKIGRIQNKNLPYDLLIVKIVEHFHIEIPHGE